MKKKLLIGILFGFFATFSILSLNPAIRNVGDISMDNISVMAQAQAEDPNPFCEYGCKEDGPGCVCYTYYPCLLDGPF